MAASVKLDHALTKMAACSQHFGLIATNVSLFLGSPRTSSFKQHLGIDSLKILHFWASSFTKLNANGQDKEPKEYTVI